MKGFESTRPVIDAALRGRILDAFHVDRLARYFGGYLRVWPRATSELIFFDGKPYRVRDENNYDFPECGDDAFVIEEVLDFKG